MKNIFSVLLGNFSHYNLFFNQTFYRKNDTFWVLIKSHLSVKQSSCISFFLQLILKTGAPSNWVIFNNPFFQFCYLPLLYSRHVIRSTYGSFKDFNVYVVSGLAYYYTFKA
jgi:hypothetical protein